MSDDRDKFLQSHIDAATTMVRHMLAISGEVDLMGMGLMCQTLEWSPILFPVRDMPKARAALMFKEVIARQGFDAAMLIAPALYKTIDETQLDAVRAQGLKAFGDAMRVVIIQWKSNWGNKGEKVFKVEQYHDGKASLGAQIPFPADSNGLGEDLWFDGMFEIVQ